MSKIISYAYRAFELFLYRNEMYLMTSRFISFFLKRNNFLFLFIGLAEGILTCFQNVKKIESWESPLEHFENLLLGAEEILLEHH